MRVPADRRGVDPFDRDDAEAPLPDAGTDVRIEESGHGSLRSSVLRRTGDLVVLAPAFAGGARARLEAGRPVRLDYVVERVPCAVPAEAGDPLRSGNVEAEQVRLRGAPVRIQRRTDFRVPDALDTRVRLLNAAGHEQRTIHGVTQNISATGALVRAAEPMTPGQRARVEIDTLEGETLVAAGRCVRAGEERRGGRRWVLAFEFDPSPAEEQRIRALVVALQRRAISRIRDA